MKRALEEIGQLLAALPPRYSSDPSEANDEWPHDGIDFLNLDGWTKAEVDFLWYSVSEAVSEAMSVRKEKLAEDDAACRSYFIALFQAATRKNTAAVDDFLSRLLTESPHQDQGFLRRLFDAQMP